MTDPTGRIFLSYRRVRATEAAMIIGALHDHGIPTWQDVSDLDPVPTEDELRRVLADPVIASALIYATPEVEHSAIIRHVEIPKIIERKEADDAFFVVPVAAGGLTYDQINNVTSSALTAQRLSDWNVHKVPADPLSPAHAAEIAKRVLGHRLQAVHRSLPTGATLRMGLFARAAPPFEAGVALPVDWSKRFADKEAHAGAWQDTLLPALASIAAAVRQRAPGREIEAFGYPTLPAALALGCAFVSTSGLRLSWRQVTRGQPDQVWSLNAPREPSGFTSQTLSKDADARDIAVLVSVTDNVEPLYASQQAAFPAMRALVRVTPPGTYPHRISSAGEAADIAHVVENAMRSVRREYGNVGAVHVFMAVPAGLAVLIGQTFNTFGAVQTYEHVGEGGSGRYKAAAHLRPSS